MKNLINRMRLAVFVALAISSFAALPATAASTKEKPNVVLVFMDDIRLG